MRNTTAQINRSTRRIAQFLAACSIAAGAVGVGAAGSAAASAQPFSGGVPQRIVDSRIGVGVDDVGPMRSGDVIAIPADGPVAMNITAVRPSGRGYLSVYPCLAGNQGTSALNFVAGAAATSNMQIASPDENGDVCVEAVVGGAGTVGVIVDRTGTFAADGPFTSNAVRRLADTRDTGKVADQSVLVLDGFVAGEAQSLGVAVAAPSRNGYITAYPCSSGRPLTSSGNFAAGEVKATTVLVVADDAGTVCVFASTATHLIVDHFGSLSGGDVDFVSPERLLDTRSDQIVRRGTAFKASFPDAAGWAVSLTVTAVRPGAAGFVTAYPCGGGVPVTSTLSFAAGQTVSNAAILQPNADGDLCFVSSAPTDLVVDLGGYINTIGSTIGDSASSDAAGDDGDASDDGEADDKDSHDGYVVEDLTADYVAALNARRAAAGIAPVNACETLVEVAEIHAVDQAANAKMSHLLAHDEYGTVTVAMIAHEIGFTPSAEQVVSNVAVASAARDIDVLVNDMWGESAGHDWWQMSPNVVNVGVASASSVDGGATYWSAVLGPADGNCTVA